MPEQQQQHGTLYAIAAYVMWGIAPLYFVAIKAVPPDEILMHRVIWSFLFVLVLIVAQRQIGQVQQLLRQPKKLGLLMVTSVLIAANWLVFIWAVGNDHVIDASLGYFINPLFNVALGMLLLKEQPGKLTLTAVAIAAIGVAYQIIQYGSVPYVSLILACTFGIYGLLRKKVQLQATTGLMVETALLLPFALLYWVFLDSPSADLSNNSTTINALLLSAGVVTTLPLLAFAAAAVRIPFYLLGMLQYIGPTLMLLMALFVFDEQFKSEQTVTFACIWVALLLMSIEAIAKAKAKSRTKRAAKS